MAGLFMAFRVRVKLPGCRTLKDRRAVVQGMVHTARDRHGFSASDLTHPLKIDYAEVGFAAVGQTEDEIRRRLDRLMATVESEIDLLGIEEHIVDGGD